MHRAERVLLESRLLADQFSVVQEEFLLLRDLWKIADTLAEAVAYPIAPRTPTAIADLVRHASQE